MRSPCGNPKSYLILNFKFWLKFEGDCDPGWYYIILVSEHWFSIPFKFFLFQIFFQSPNPRSTSAPDLDPFKKKKRDFTVKKKYSEIPAKIHQKHKSTLFNRLQLRSSPSKFRRPRLPFPPSTSPHLTTTTPPPSPPSNDPSPEPVEASPPSAKPHQHFQKLHRRFQIHVALPISSSELPEARFFVNRVDPS